MSRQRSSKSMSSGARTSMEPLRALASKTNDRLSGSNNLHRFSQFGGRPSFAKPMSVTGQQVRSSSQYGRNAGQDRKDPRPVMDKTFQRSCIEELISYVISLGYPHPISPKLLNLPQAKEFVKLFEFLYRQLDPDFTLPRKFDEYIVKLLKFLGYPFNITKSYFASVGSPHAWPHVLATLHWLMHTIQASEVNGLMDLIYPTNEFNANPVDRLRFFALADGYSAFLRQEDNHDMALDAYTRELDKITGNGSDDLESLKQMNFDLTEQYNALIEQPELYRAELDKKESLKSDLVKFKDYICQMEVAQDKLIKKLDMADSNRSILEARIEALSAENASLQASVDGQELSVIDVERLKEKSDMLQSNITAAQTQLDKIYKDIWEEEMRVAKADTKIEAQMSKYNEQARQLMATDLCGQDVDIEIKDTSDSRRYPLVIKPILHGVIKDKERVLQQEERKLQELADAYEQVKGIVTQRERELLTLDSQYKHMQKEIDCSKQVWQKKEDLLRGEIEELSTDAISIDHQNNMDNLDMVVELKEFVKQGEEKIAEKKRESKAAKESTDKTAVWAVQQRQRLSVKIADYTDSINKDSDIIRHEYQEIMKGLGLPTDVAEETTPS